MVYISLFISEFSFLYGVNVLCLVFLYICIAICGCLCRLINYYATETATINDIINYIASVQILGYVSDYPIKYGRIIKRNNNR